MSRHLRQDRNRAASTHATATRRCAFIAAWLACLGAAGPALAQPSENVCGSLSNAFGPFDYRADHYRAAPDDREPHSQKLHLVESAHFGPIVEQLRGGMTTSRPGHDLDYTLRAFPNHPRALMAALRLWERDRQTRQVSTVRPAECYFERAIRFQPFDITPRILYARFLVKDERVQEAVRQLEWIGERTEDNPYTHYNMGMIYLEAKLYDEALKHAHRALQLGLAERGLATQLQAAGRWREPQDPNPGLPAGAATGPAPAASGTKP